MLIPIDNFSVVRVRGDVSPTIFLPRSLAKEIGSLAVLKSGRNRIIACVLPNSLIKNKICSDGIAINTNSYLSLREPRNLVIERINPEKTIFVYGTLLSKYWNPYVGELNSGWIKIGSPYIRGVIKEVLAIWPRKSIYPLIKEGNKIVLGELYPNVSPQVIEYLNSTESQLIRRRVDVFPIENFVRTEAIPAQMYIHVGDRKRGLKSRTFRYPDAYYVLKYGFISYNFSEDLLVKWIHGNSPIVLTSPHGGLARPTDTPPSNNMYGDSFTLEITENIVKKTFELSGWTAVPSAIISRIHRNIVDLNRPWMPKHEKAAKIYLTYHRAIRRAINLSRKKHSRTLILDIHGMKNYGPDIILGTNYGRSIRGFGEELNELKETLEKKFSVDVDNHGLSGYYTTMRYGALLRVGVIQVEISMDIRMSEQKRSTLVNLLAEYIVSTTEKH